MRKKLFAVIMSAMMMVTFMPAMAFAWGPTPTPVTRGFTVDGVATTAGGDYVDVYDGAEHAVVFNLPAATTETLTGYTMAYSATTWVTLGEAAKYTKTDAPKVKAAGYYTIKAYLKQADTETGGTVTPGATKVEVAWVQVTPRQVLVSAKNTTVSVLKEKNYDGKGFVIGDADFNITPLYNDKTKAYDKAGTGLVAGDTLFVKAVETPADAGVYEVSKLSHFTNINTNYEALVETDANHNTRAFVGSVDAKSYTAVILKADNNVTLSKTNKTYTAKALKKAKKSFKINPKATWGDVKVTKVGGSGYLYLNGNKVVVKKGAKKGTYQIKVKAYVVGNSNYASASLTKVINVKVK